VRGNAIVTACDARDDELDSFLIALAQIARREHGIGGEHRLEGGRSVGADCGEGVWPIAFLIWP